jgi:hypothetical protein
MPMTNNQAATPSGKFSVASLVIDHYQTFCVYPGKRIKKSDYAIYVGLPLVVAVLIIIFKLRANNIPNILAAIAILTGLIFNAVLLLSDLSTRAIEAARGGPRGEDILRLAKELRSNISYAVLIGLLLSALLGGISMFSNVSKPVPYGITAIICAVGVQLLLTVGMILKRLRSLFGSFELDYEEQLP